VFVVTTFVQKTRPKTRLSKTLGSFFIKPLYAIH